MARGKNQNFHRKDEVRRKVLDLQVERIARDGLRMSIDDFNYEEAIRLAEVPRSTAYSVWARKDSLATDLLVELANPVGRVSGAFDEETILAARGVLQDHPEMMASKEGRNALAVEAIRLAADRNCRALRGTRRWEIYVALLTTLPGMKPGPDRSRLEQALQNSERQFIGQMSAFYTEMLRWFQFKPREGVSVELIAGLGGALVEGWAQRSIVNPSLADAPIKGPAIDGGLVDWHPAALGFLGVALLLVDGLEVPRSWTERR